MTTELVVNGGRKDLAARRGRCSCCVRPPDTWLFRCCRPIGCSCAVAAGSFTFADAENLLDYLDELGVSHLYLSPILTAVDGSTHGYDVTDPTTVSPELGGAEGLARLSAAARARGMGLIVDIVPNHVGVDKPEQNPWWWDVLRHGRDSAYASFFDIDWDLDERAESCCRCWVPTMTSPT